MIKKTIQQWRSFLRENRVFVLGLLIGAEVILGLLLFTFYLEPILDCFGRFGTFLTRVIGILFTALETYKGFTLLKAANKLSLPFHAISLLSLAVFAVLSHIFYQPLYRLLKQYGICK